METPESPEEARPEPEKANGKPVSSIPGFIVPILGLALMLTLVGVGIVYVYKIRVTQHRLESATRLKNLGIAALMYHDLLKHLPSNGTQEPYDFQGQKAGGVADANRFFSGSWAYRVLPVIELKFDPGFRFPFPDQEKTKKLAPTYHCAMRDRPLYAEGEGFQNGPFTDFVLNPYLNDRERGGLNEINNRTTLVGILDGSANTILFGHGWISTDDLKNPSPGPGRCSIYLGGTNGTARNGKQLVRDKSGSQHYDEWGSPYAEGGMMCMADATVRFFTYDMESSLLFNFLHPNDKANPMLPTQEPTDDKRFDIK